MTSRNLHRKFDPQPVRMPVASATVIEVGDMIQEDGSGNALPASSEAWDTNLATTQANFKATFVGVAMSASANGETEDVVVATAGVFEFDCAAAQFDYGDPVGPDEVGTQTLGDQQVEAAVIASAIGHVVKTYNANTTRILVMIHTFARFDAP